MLWNKKFLPTDHHLWTDLIYRRRLVDHKPVKANANTMHAGAGGRITSGPQVGKVAT